MFNLERYTQLQTLRETGRLTAAEKAELHEMCSDHLFNMIETIPELLDVFARLKVR